MAGVLLKYKGDSSLEAGFFYAPYVPLYTTSIAYLRRVMILALYARLRRRRKQTLVAIAVFCFGLLSVSLPLAVVGACAGAWAICNAVATLRRCKKLTAELIAEELSR